VRDRNARLAIGDSQDTRRHDLDDPSQGPRRSPPEPRQPRAAGVTPPPQGSPERQYLARVDARRFDIFGRRRRLVQRAERRQAEKESHAPLGA
jgi:hypothetical protein